MLHNVGIDAGESTRISDGTQFGTPQRPSHGTTESESSHVSSTLLPSRQAIQAREYTAVTTVTTAPGHWQFTVGRPVARPSGS
jgi:hypothetical protein